MNAKGLPVADRPCPEQLDLTGSFCHGVVAAIAAQELPGTHQTKVDSSRGGPRSMVPVRLAGAEVTVTWVPLMFSAARHGENEFC